MRAHAIRTRRYGPFIFEFVCDGGGSSGGGDDGGGGGGADGGGVGDISVAGDGEEGKTGATFCEVLCKLN